MATNLTLRQQAYAFWGVASNPRQPLQDRLDCALQALDGIQGLLETAEQEAQLLAGQRDRLLGHCQMVESVRHQKMVPLDEVYGILITDGSDNP